MLTLNVSRPFSLDLASNSLDLSSENLPVDLDNHAVKTPLTIADEARRQELRDTVLIASNLVSKLEQMNYMYAIDALQKMNASKRLTIARTMLGINKQHRRIMESLPYLNLAVLRIGSSEFLYHIQITYTVPNETPAVFSFTFDPDELETEFRAAN